MKLRWPVAEVIRKIRRFSHSSLTKTYRGSEILLEYLPVLIMLSLPVWNKGKGCERKALLPLWTANSWVRESLIVRMNRCVTCQALGSWCRLSHPLQHRPELKASTLQDGAKIWKPISDLCEMEKQNTAPLSIQTQNAMLSIHFQSKKLTLAL